MKIQSGSNHMKIRLIISTKRRQMADVLLIITTTYACGPQAECLQARALSRLKIDLHISAYARAQCVVPSIK